MANNLRNGSRGEDVRLVQVALNKKLVPGPKLKEDGVYGGMTAAAVKKYQAANWLVEDGIAGACTQNALLDKETYTPILHKIQFIAQPNDNTCWAASTAMMTNSNVAAVRAKTPKAMLVIDADGNEHGLQNPPDSGKAIAGGTEFAKLHGLTFHPPMSWMLSALRARLQAGPMMWDMLWSASDYAADRDGPGHMIVIVGMRGDDQADGKATTMRIHDPWPPTKGKVYSVGFFKWMQEVPTRTYRTFTK
jgi:peptidoglycan hydrolase-like protein with peptidoglycan-binding domain